MNADYGLGIVVSEEQCLQQIYIDEQFGDIESRKIEEDKKKWVTASLFSHCVIDTFKHFVLKLVVPKLW